LQATIADGAPRCRVVVHLTSSAEADAAEGRAYFRSR
jgi:hypothetical protein